MLLHGLGSSSPVWDPVRPALAASNETVAFDLPGQGGSSPLPAHVDPGPMALTDAVEAELDRQDLHAPHLCGNSLGGRVALELARRGRAASVVAISPAGKAVGAERVYALNSLKLSRLRAVTIAPWASETMAGAAARTSFFAQIRSRPWRMPAELAAHEVRMIALPAFRPMLYATLGPPRAAEGFDAIRCPVTIAWGTRDLLLLRPQARRFVDEIPGARLRWLRGAGHSPTTDDPDQTASAILEHLAAARESRRR